MAGDQPLTLLAAITRADAHPALVRPGAESLSYAELHDAVDALACQLAAVGRRRRRRRRALAGQRPAVRRGVPRVIAAGAAAAPLNPAYTEQELRGYLDDLRPQAIVLDGTAGENPVAAARQLELPVHMLGPDAKLEGVTPAHGHATGTPDSVALLLHTSGTTSRPKAVPLRQRNLVRLGAHDRRRLRAGRSGRQPLRDAAVPRARPRRLDARDARDAAARSLVPRRFSAGAFWERRRERRRHLVLGGADDPSASSSPRAGRRGARASPALRAVVLVRAPGTTLVASSRSASRRRSWRPTA